MQYMYMYSTYDTCSLTASEKTGYQTMATQPLVTFPLPISLTFSGTEYPTILIPSNTPLLQHSHPTHKNNGYAYVI